MEGEEDIEVQRIHKMGQVVMGLGIMGRIQVTPRWANGPVWLHDGSRRESGQGRVRAPPQMEIRRREEKGRAG